MIDQGSAESFAYFYVARVITRLSIRKTVLEICG